MVNENPPDQQEFAARIEAAASLHYVGKSESALEKLNELLSESFAKARADFRPTINAHRAVVLRSLQYFDRAIQASEEACRGFRRLGNLDEVIRQLLMMASICTRTGEAVTALELSVEAIELSELTGNSRLRASAESARGLALGCLGRYEEEAQAAEEALNIVTGLSDNRGVAIAKLNLGACFSNLGRFDEATTLLLEARQTLLDLGFLLPSFSAANALAEVYLSTGQIENVRVIVRELQKFQVAGDGPEGTDSPGIEDLEAQLLAADGDIEGAIEMAKQSAAILEERDMLPSASKAHAFIAELHLKAGRHDEASASAQTAYDLLAPTGVGGRQDLLRALVPWAEAELALDRLQLAAGLLTDVDSELKNAPESYLVKAILAPRADMLKTRLKAKIFALKQT